jgi:hypothetical protein
VASSATASSLPSHFRAHPISASRDAGNRSSTISPLSGSRTAAWKTDLWISIAANTWSSLLDSGTMKPAIVTRGPDDTASSHPYRLGSATNGARHQQDAFGQDPT